MPSDHRAQVTVSRLLEPLDSDRMREFVDALVPVNAVADKAPGFVHGPPHIAIMRGRRKWFAPPTEAMTALWWIPAGSRPTPLHAEERLTMLRRTGPSAQAFTLRTPFPAPGEQRTIRSRDCPV